MTNPSKPANDRCRVCQDLDLVELTRFDLLVGDPARWPRTLWQEHGWAPPKGLLPPHYRTWGARAVGRDWLDHHGYNHLTDKMLIGHLRHVAKVARRPVDLVDVGVVVGQPALKDDPTPGRAIDPNAYLAYYAKGVQMGLRGLVLLEKRLDKMEADNVPVPLDLIKMLIDGGAKLATSQAGIRARGQKLHEDDDADAFRRAASPEPNGEVPRIGAHRIRTIEGELRPVTDRGMNDRAAYNERAREEGNPELPT